MRDRHERLGEGHIGIGAIAELLAHPATAGVPFILETPGSRDPGSDQIALVKRLRAMTGRHVQARSPLRRCWASPPAGAARSS